MGSKGCMTWEDVMMMTTVMLTSLSMLWNGYRGGDELGSM
jgi:hypothetical protein